MTTRNFLNLFFRIISILFIYKILIAIGIGRLSHVNFIELPFSNNFILSQISWLKIVYMSLLFFVFKYPWILSDRLLRNNSLIDDSETNQILIFKSTLLIFGFAGLVNLIFFSVKYLNIEHQWLLGCCYMTFLLLIIVLREKISWYMVRKIKQCNGDTNHSYIFQLISLLFYIVFFDGILSSSLSVSQFLLNVFFFLLIINAAPLYFLFTRKSINISNSQFTSVLIFWILLLNYIYRYFNQQSFSLNSSEIALEYTLVYLTIPVLGLFFHKEITRFKSINLLCFIFLVVSYEYLFFSINKINQNLNFYTQIFCSILFALLGYFSQRKVKIFNLSKVPNTVNIPITTPIYIPITIILFLVYRIIDKDYYIIPYYENKTILYYILYGLISLAFVQIINFQSIYLKTENTTKNIFLLSFLCLFIYQKIDLVFSAILYPVTNFELEIISTLIAIFVFIFSLKITSVFFEKSN